MYVCMHLYVHAEHIYTHMNTILVVRHLGHVAYCCFSHAFLLKFLDFSICLSFFATFRCAHKRKEGQYASGIMISVESYSPCKCFLQGIENVYTQHQPLLFQTIESIVKGRLRDIDYPFIGNHFQHGRFDLNIPNFII